MRIHILIVALLAASQPVKGAPPKPVESTPTEHARPAFSWDRVPQYMHIRKAAKFTDAEIKYLASFPRVAFEKTTGHRAFNSTEDGTLAAAKALIRLIDSPAFRFQRTMPG